MLYMAANHSEVWKLRANGLPFGWLLSPGAERRPIRGDRAIPYAIDNGLFRPPGAPPAPESACLNVYELLCKSVRLNWPRPLWYVVPDVPYDGAASLRRTMEHAPRLAALFPDVPQAIAVQDGMSFEAAEPFPVVFVAGSTDWKLRTLAGWAKWANERGKLCHVARVNTARRLRRCLRAGAASADGTAIAKGHRASLSALVDTLRAHQDGARLFAA